MRVGITFLYLEELKNSLSSFPIHEHSSSNDFRFPNPRFHNNIHIWFICNRIYAFYTEKQTWVKTKSIPYVIYFADSPQSSLSSPAHLPMHSVWSKVIHDCRKQNLNLIKISISKARLTKIFKNVITFIIASLAKNSRCHHIEHLNNNIHVNYLVRDVHICQERDRDKSEM